MTFVELLDKTKTVSYQELRKDAVDYLELVIPSAASSDLCRVLEEFFGPPFKPAGLNPSKEAEKHASRWGGVQKNQVLYYLEADGVSNCAMLWPWGSGAQITVKIASGHIDK